MTFREKLAQDFPENVRNNYGGGCLGCPRDYGYPELRLCSFSDEATDNDCQACWDQEMPEPKPEPKDETPDMVNRPPHYTAGGIECIDAIAAALSSHKDPMGAWLTGQVIKYLWRWPLKNGVEDLKKARFYLDRLIRQEET